MIRMVPRLITLSKLDSQCASRHFRLPNRASRPPPTAAIPDRTHPEATMARSRQSRRKGLNRDFPDRILPRAENASRPGYRGPSGLWLGHCMAIFWWFDRIERARFGIPCCAVACRSLEDAQSNLVYRLRRRSSAIARGHRGPQEPAEARLAGADDPSERRGIGHLGDHGRGGQIQDLRVALAGAAHV